MTTTLDSLNKLADVYARARAALADKVTALNDAIAQLKRDNLSEVKRLINRASEAEAKLMAEIEANPEHFVKPKTLTTSGVKFGYQKTKGSISFDDADSVVARIRKHLPDQADVLIQTKEVPSKTALALLPGADLKKLGVSLTPGGDQVVIKTTDSDVDKMVESLLKAASSVEGQ